MSSLKIALLGASGNIGSAVLRELSSRGSFFVTAIARDSSKVPTGLPNVTVVGGDASKPAELAPRIKGIDVLISALHFDVTADKILDLAKSAGAKRVVVVGGAGSLLVAEGGPRLIDSPDFPKEYIPFAKPGVEFLDYLRTVTDFDWTFFSPPAEIGPGERTQKFRLGKDILLTDSEGKSRISYDDYAIALVDEVKNHNVSKARFTAAY